MRYSFNTLKSIQEIGTTSNWILTFRKDADSLAPDVENFNLIAKQYCPAIDVQFDDFNLNYEDLTVGPGKVVPIPTFLKQYPDNIAITVYDTYERKMRTAIKNWVYEMLKVVKGKTPPVKELQKYSLIITVSHFNKELKILPSNTRDSFRILPPNILSFRGDQSFGLDTIPLSFRIIDRLI